MGMDYDAFMDHDFVALFDRLRGFQKQWRENLELQRAFIVEQTCHMINMSGKVNKGRNVTPRDFGVKTGRPVRPADPEELKKKIARARSIEWRVGTKKQMQKAKNGTS